ncbi:MAG: hypothetical protein ACLPOO_06115 [Terriglobales bacterium]|jgi:hypothetical protein
MRYLVWLFLVAVPSFSTDSPCVILAPVEPPQGMATWSQVGRQQRHAMIYLAGEYPPGIPFRSQIKDKDVDKIRSKGGRVLILDSHYTHDDLEKARKQCGISVAEPSPGVPGQTQSVPK